MRIRGTLVASRSMCVKLLELATTRKLYRLVYRWVVLTIREPRPSVFRELFTIRVMWWLWGRPSLVSVLPPLPWVITLRCIGALAITYPVGPKQRSVLLTFSSMPA